MNYKARKKILEVATDARAFMETFARDNPTIGDPTTLGCYCAIASGHLHTALKKNGIKAQIAINDHHAFVLVDDGSHIVDITATQFDDEYDPVMLLPLPSEPNREEFWEPKAVFNSPRALRKHQVKDGWPMDQRAVLKIC